MRAKKPSQGIEIKTTALRLISGSDDEDFTSILVTQVATSLWVEHSNSEQRDRQFNAAITAMKGMKPGDELEGMLSAQLIAIHNAAMEYCQRAMLGNQTFEGRRESLNQANKLSRTYAARTEALDRHRGKGQQRITVEHVNVHVGGQAIVGDVTPRDRKQSKIEEQTRATREITNEPGIPMRARTRSGRPSNRRRCTENAGVECMVVQPEAARQSAT